MNKKKIAVVVADSYGYPFEEIKKLVQPLIWNFIDPPDIFYMRGQEPNLIATILNNFSDKQRYTKLWPIQRAVDQIQINLTSMRGVSTFVKDDQIVIDIPEGLRFLGLKLLRSLNCLYEMGYEVVYKTTLSSIVNGENFRNVTEAIQDDYPFYGGTPINFGRHPFASGANLMLNRKSIAELINRQSQWNHGLLDDVAIGRLLENYAEISEISTLNIASKTQLASISDSQLRSITHFRCKSALTVRDDVQIMLALHERLSN